MKALRHAPDGTVQAEEKLRRSFGQLAEATKVA
jgi:hypothetical protein